MVDIPDGFVSIHGSKKAVYIDPLAQLAKFRTVQLVTELILPQKQNLEKLMLLGFNIGKEPDFLNAFIRKKVGLIDYQDKTSLPCGWLPPKQL